MKTTSHKIVLIGAGNIATHLGLAFKKNNLAILQVISKHQESSSLLAKKLKCKSSISLNDIDYSADLFFICVNDDSIKEIADILVTKNKIIVHTSGSIAMDVLKKSSSNVGVFYPLQTFSKNKKVDFRTIPICIEASNSKTLKTLESLALSISNNVQKINSEQRKQLHLAAVFACNFTNHLFSIAYKLVNDAQLSFDLLKPLIEETIEKIKHLSPIQVQTGPAIRGDKKTMEAHLKMLENKEGYKQLYKLLSKSIANTKTTN